MRWLALTLILLFPAPVAAQEAGEPQAGAAYANQYCAKCHAIADEHASPDRTAAPLQGCRQYLRHDGYRFDGLATDFAPDYAQYHPRTERHE